MRFSSLGNSLRVLTPAKINLSLRILGRRMDGYHDLQTLMVSIRLYDLLEFSPTKNSDVSLQLQGVTESFQDIPTDGGNLICKAARLLQMETGCQRGVSIFLKKSIPAEAGLGGGSSNAAATLQGLDQFWGLNLGRDRLHELAARLGSDVNFFLDSTPAALCSGRGEKITAVPLQRPLHVVIVKPASGLSTARVFQKWSQLQGSAMPVEMRHRPFGPLAVEPLRGSFRDHIINDLETPARILNNEIDRVLKQFSKQDLVGSGMTGSGSACFALCRTARHALAVAGRCRSRRLGRVDVVSSGI